MFPSTLELDKHSPPPPIPERVHRNHERLRAQLQAHFEANWSRWAETLNDVDPHTLLQLRAAFRAGYEAGR